MVYRNCSSTFSVDLSVSVLNLSGHVDLLETKFINEPVHEKTNNLPMRKQRRRSASRLR